MLFPVGLGVLAVVALLFVARHRNGVWLVRVRDVLFTDFEDNRAFLTWPPRELATRGFRMDSTEDRRCWGLRLARVPYLASELSRIAQLPTDVSKAQELVRLFSRGGGQGCGSIDSLLEKIRQMPEGYGCCSDHTEAFLATAQQVSVEAREMVTSRHSVNEFYDPTTQRWIFIDPQLAVMAANEHGDYLSLLDIRDHCLEGVPIVMQYFGHASHASADSDPRIRQYYGESAALLELRMTYGNNVYEADRFAETWRWLPKAVRQLIGHVAGVIPGYVMYVDRHNSADLKALQFWSVLAARLRRKPPHLTVRRSAETRCVR